MPRVLMPARLTACLLSVSLLGVGCSGGSQPSSAPKDAAKADYCSAYASILDNFGQLTPGDTEKQLAQMKTWAGRLSETGTPKDLSPEARAGFEKVIEVVEGLDAEKLKSLGELDAGMAQRDRDNVLAFETYTQETCGDLLNSLQMPSPASQPAPSASPK